MIRIIGFSGGMGVGKSTAITMLKERLLEREVALLKFAQPLYDMQEFIYRRIASIYPRSAGFVKDRKLLQWIGTDWGRETISKTIWIDLWKVDAKKFLSEHPVGLLVCDDVRFDNEAEAIHALGGYVIKLEASDPASRIITTDGLFKHKSEEGIDSALVDATIINDDTKEELDKRVWATYLYFKNKQTQKEG